MTAGVGSILLEDRAELLEVSVSTGRGHANRYAHVSWPTLRG